MNGKAFNYEKELIDQQKVLIKKEFYRWIMDLDKQLTGFSPEAKIGFSYMIQKCLDEAMNEYRDLFM